jgi:hypothetical protein
VKVYDIEAVKERLRPAAGAHRRWKASSATPRTKPRRPRHRVTKTVTALLQQWGTLRTCSNTLPKRNRPKPRRLRSQSRARPAFSKRLATIVCDVPALPPIRPLRAEPQDWQRRARPVRRPGVQSLAAASRPRSRTPRRSRRRSAAPEDIFVALRYVARRNAWPGKRAASVKRAGKRLSSGWRRTMRPRCGRRCADRLRARPGSRLLFAFPEGEADQRLGGLFGQARIPPRPSVSHAAKKGDGGMRGLSGDMARRSAPPAGRPCRTRSAITSRLPRSFWNGMEAVCRRSHSMTLIACLACSTPALAPTRS